VSVDELRKKEKECRRLKHELSTEKEKFNEMVGKYQADLQTLQVGTHRLRFRSVFTGSGFDFWKNSIRIHL
jgi:hypothetical protein